MKRFTETTKWDDPWFMDLPVKYKLFWLYVCDRCDVAGFWEPNMRLAVAQIGEPIELVEVLRVFEKRIEQIPDGKLWIRKFVQFQQGQELNPLNNAHRGILRRLNENKIASPLPIHNSPCQGAKMGLTSPISKSNSKGKSKSKEEEGTGGKPNLVPSAEDIYQAYPRHESKPDGLKAINKAVRNGFGRAFLLERTIAYAKTQPPRDRFTPLPATWFNAERFNDDPSEWTRRDDSKRKRPPQPWETVRKPKPKFDDLYPT